MSCFLQFFTKCRKLTIILLSTTCILLYVARRYLEAAYSNSGVVQQSVAPVLPFYHKQHSLDCSKLLLGDELEIDIARNSTNNNADFTEYQLYKMLRGNCSALHSLYYFPPNVLSQEEKRFPISYSILVNEHAHYVLKLLNAIYAPQNFYCLHVDLKSSSLFRKTIATIAECLPNVFLASDEVSVVWGGYSMVQAMLNCIKDLYDLSDSWRYVITLNNHDFPLRTNREIVEILKLHNGRNDDKLTYLNPGRADVPHVAKFNLQGAENGIKRLNNTFKGTPPMRLHMYKGSQQASLSRDFVNFLLNDARSLALQDYLKDSYIPDETLWSTLIHNENKLGAPGSYPGRCISQRKPKDWITRHSDWLMNGYRCQGKWRNSICVYGYGDLRHVVSQRSLFLNKFLPHVDAHALNCMHERIFNRTYRHNVTQQVLDVRNQYGNISSVRYAQWLADGKSSAEFPC